MIRYINCENAIPDPANQNMLTCREVDINNGAMPLSLITVDCKTYENYGGLNIADLIEYLWNVDSNVKQFNVSFYQSSECYLKKS